MDWNDLNQSFCNILQSLLQNSDKIVWLKSKNFSYSKDDGSKDKKARSTKKSVIKIKIKFENYKNFLEAIQLENKLNDLEKSQINADSLKKVNKIALSLNDDKRM